jgi:hypothetical protein
MYIYFSTYNPYDEKYDYFLDYINKKEQETIVDTTNECAICLTTSTISNKLETLKSTKIINKSCNCNVYIHETCLRNWVKIALTCPICRSKLYYLNYSFVETSEKFIRGSYLFLVEYKDILLIILCYLCFLQTCIFCIIIINYKINEELLYHNS